MVSRTTASVSGMSAFLAKNVGLPTQITPQCSFKNATDMAKGRAVHVLGMINPLQGRTQGEGPGGPDPPLVTQKNTRFSAFLPLNYVIFVFATRVLKLFAM